MHGVRWRRNADALDGVYARALGFRRNHHEAAHDSATLSNTDRLVHATWNAVAHAFRQHPAAGRCSVEETVVLEGELLPAPDFVAFFEHGLAIMQARPHLCLSLSPPHLH